MVELDVRRSGDGKLILSHDPTLDGKPVSTTPWSELAELDIGDGHHPALLDEVTAALPDTPIQFEIKNFTGEPGFEPDHRVALEAASRARSGDIVTSFNRRTIEAVRDVFEDVATGLAIGFPGDLGEAASYCLEIGHSAMIPAAGLVTESVVHHVESGLDVFPWTVNDENVAAELVEAGVSGIITDDPALIAQTVRGEE